MAFANRPPQTAGQVGQQKVKEFFSQSAPVPKSVVVGSRAVGIGDLAESITAARDQKRFLDEFSMPWPCVHLSSGGTQPSSSWVPIDLRNIEAGPPYDNQTLLRDISHGDAQARALDRARDSGLNTAELPTAECQRVFTDMLGEVIGRRYAGSSGGSGVPTALFQVVTLTQGVEVVYADGFFFSTVRGFGYSSPAQMHLPYGNYVFGYATPNGPEFGNATLWKVPDHAFARIDV